MNKYEAVIIFGPNSSNEEMDAVLTKMKDVITADGELKEVFDWGKKRFAYPIFKKTEGFYYLLTFDAKPEVPLELNRIARITEFIFRLRVFLRDDSVTAMPPPRRNYNRSSDRYPRNQDEAGESTDTPIKSVEEPAIVGSSKTEPNSSENKPVQESIEQNQVSTFQETLENVTVETEEEKKEETNAE
ncbi:MAG: 30S ribosomal protein S6 [Caldisericia bacterium]|nr:30S ribosomal protein S6 [Caldisericia bacterium]MDD4614098.1 30S ribosomal protein S6 [Caldisericia bacterium]